MEGFRKWTRQSLLDEFGLKMLDSLPSLTHWLALEAAIETSEATELEQLRVRLAKKVDIWNEQELIVKFIALLMDLVNFDTAYYQTYANRKLKARVDGKELSGEVDFMVASGEFEPKAPYFCLYEYKREQSPDKEPAGQLLAAMLAAQTLNTESDEPIYGAYVVGRNWFFVVLEGREYAISNSFTATKQEILDIFKALKSLRGMIAEQVAT